MRIKNVKVINQLKSFIGVQFIDDSNDVVPKEWITTFNEDTKKLMWPPKYVEKHARKVSKVKSSWRSHDFTPLCHASK